MNCRHCGSFLEHVFLDLGFAPPSNAYRKQEDLAKPEVYFPLRLLVCDRCWLVQTEDYTSSEMLFDGDYAYYSSTSVGWLEHARVFSDGIVDELGLGDNSFVLEIASNDGYLLKNFVAKGIPCLGVEPTASTASAAERIGVPVLRAFFNEETARLVLDSHGHADLVVGNNVFAHVPDVNGFARAIGSILSGDGVVTLEFPHLKNLIEKNQFDTVYHEHFSYLSLHAVNSIFSRCGLRLWKVEELSTHGGSLRVYGCRQDSLRQIDESVDIVLREERRFGMLDIALYRGFQQKAEAIKNDFLEFLISKKKEGKRVLGYGAAAKGCTLLNFSGVKRDLIPVIADAAPAKQGKFTPGSHIPIVSPSVLRDMNPDYLIIFPWNIADEVISQNEDMALRGTRFVTFVPALDVRR